MSGASIFLFTIFAIFPTTTVIVINIALEVAHLDDSLGGLASRILHDVGPNTAIVAHYYRRSTGGLGHQRLPHECYPISPLHVGYCGVVGIGGQTRYGGWFQPAPSGGRVAQHQPSRVVVRRRRAELGHDG